MIKCYNCSAFLQYSGGGNNCLLGLFNQSDKCELTYDSIIEKYKKE